MIAFSAEGDQTSVWRKGWLVAIQIPVRQLDGISVRYRLYPDIEDAAVRMIGRIGQKLSIRRDCRIRAQSGIRCEPCQDHWRGRSRIVQEPAKKAGNRRAQYN